MKITEENKRIRIDGLEDFEPERIFECGQCFRWDRQPDGSYIGVVGSRAARVEKIGESVFISGTAGDFDDIWRDYFDLNRDYALVRERVAIDDYMTSACRFGRGIRILRQDKWEALCSFIISQCNNITRIKGIVSRLCGNFGSPIEFEGRTYYTFPPAERLAGLSTEDLAPLRCGYRADYIIGAAEKVASGELDLEAVSLLPEKEMRAALMSLNGVGKKVANCMMLFGLHRLDAFPVDVWIKRVIDGQYGGDFDPGIFGEYAGIAQQYMFYYARSGAREEEK